MRSVRPRSRAACFLVNLVNSVYIPVDPAVRSRACALTDFRHMVLLPEIVTHFPRNFATLSMVMCGCANGSSQGQGQGQGHKVTAWRKWGQLNAKYRDRAVISN